MGMGSAPKPPDPKQTAAAQTSSNVATATANAALGNVDQYTPFGSLTYQQIGQQQVTDPSTGQTYFVPRYAATQTLSANQQRMQNEQERTGIATMGLAGDAAERLRGHMGTNLSFSGLPQGGSANQIGTPQLDRMGVTDFNQDRANVEDAIMSRMQPRMDQDREGLRSRLVNQGIREGSEAYDRAMGRFDEQVNDARMQAVLAGGQEQSRMADLRFRRAGFNNQTGQQQFGNDMALAARRDTDRATARDEMFALRNQPINEISALLGTGQVTQPSFVNPSMPQIPGTDIAGLTMDNYNARLNNWQTQQAQRQGMMGGLLGTAGNIGSGMILMSDRRLKRDVRRIGSFGRLAVYAWRYVWGAPGMGFMADEVARIAPHAVVRVGAFDAVDYGTAMEAAR